MKLYSPLTLIILVWACSLNAQVIDTARLRLVFTPQLINSQKINQQAKIVDTVTEQVNFDYYIVPQKLDIKFNPSPIKAAKIAPDVVEQLYRNFIKVGFGYPVTPLAELSMHNCNNKKYSFGLNFHHFSSWYSKIGKMKDYINANTSDTRLHFFFNRFYKFQTLYSSIGYNHELAYLYGFNKNLGYDEYYYSKPYNDTLKNSFHHLKAEIGLRSNYTLEEKRLKQDVRLNYDLIYTKKRDMENHIGLDSYFAYDARFLKISGSQNYRADFTVDYYNNSWNDTILGGSKRIDNALKIELKPTLNFTVKEYHLLLGVGLPLCFNTAIGAAKFPIYPVAEIQLGLVKGLLSLYAGIDGNAQFNSLQKLLYENPYIKPQLDSLLFTRTQISLYGGVKGNLVKKMNYHISARYSDTKDMVFYMLDTTALLRNQFDIVYSDALTLNVCANLNWEVIDHLYLNVDANYWGYYKTTNMDTVLYKPSWEVAFGGKYTLKQKLIFNLNFKLGFGRWGFVPTYVSDYSRREHIEYAIQKMKPILDFGVGFEYLITPQLSAFVNINNIGCQYYAKYYDFNNIGINGIVGITYSFGNESLKPAKKKR